MNSFASKSGCHLGVNKIGAWIGRASLPNGRRLMRKAMGTLSKQRLGEIGYALALTIVVSTTACGQICLAGEGWGLDRTDHAPERRA